MVESDKIKIVYYSFCCQIFIPANKYFRDIACITLSVRSPLSTVRHVKLIYVV